MTRNTDAEIKYGLDQRRVLAATSISYVVVILDTSIVNVALERIASDLATDITGLQWVVNAYTLTFASLLLTGGTLGDLRGARNIYLAGVAVFTAASALCGIAPDLAVLITARVLQGIGAAMLVPCSLTLINNAVPDPDKRAAAIGLWAGCGAAAMAAGPLIGGILIHLLGWRSIFFVNVPIGLVGTFLTFQVARNARSSQGRPIDLAGQLAAILALGTTIAVLIERVPLGWSSPLILSGIAIGSVAWAAFLFIEARQPQPMLPLSLFRNPIFSGSAMVSMVSALTFYGLMFLLSLFYQQMQGYTPLQTGLAFLPATALVTAGSLASSRLAQAYGRRQLVCAALVLYALGFLGMLLSTPISPYWLTALPMPAIGLAAGLITPAMTAALMGIIDKGRAGIAAGVLNSARQTGASLGVAIFGTLAAAIHPFEIGMHVALSVAATLSLLAALVWWLAIGSETGRSD
jgi:MFS transporter, DHA2 family, methylenomycin A resistance protein